MSGIKLEDSVKPGRVVVRGATESDLPNIERQYGPLDNVGDPFCDTSKLTKIRYDHLLVAQVDGTYAGFLYWHIGKKPFFAPRVTRFAHIREVQVLKKFRRQGVGKKLTLNALHRLKALGIGTSSLQPPRPIRLRGDSTKT